MGHPTARGGGVGVMGGVMKKSYKPMPLKKIKFRDFFYFFFIFFSKIGHPTEGGGGG